MQRDDAPQPRISNHAVERYIQRVEPVSAAVAARRLATLAARATRRPTPRHWMNTVPATGALFLYPTEDPDVCLILKGDTIVTVYSRVICLRWRTGAHPEPRGRIRRPYRRPAPGTWPLEAA